MNTVGKLLAIDGLSIVRRVYQAIPGEDTPERAEAAVDKSYASFRILLDGHAPSHVAAAFDYGGRTWRHDLYAGYKQNREPMPPHLKARLPDFYASLGNLGLKPISIEGVEADDVIGTVVMRWLSEGRGDAVVASTDKDLHVLIEFGALLWDHFEGKWHDREWVIQRFGVPPEMLTDFLALAGDRTDGIPGVDRIGAKKAAQLLNSYKNIEGIMAGAGILLDTTGKNLRAGRYMAFLSRQLVQLKTDVQLGLTWRALEYAGATPRN